MPRGVYKRKPARKLSTRGQRVVKKIRRRSNPGVHDDIPTIAKSSLIKSSISPASSDVAKLDGHPALTVERSRGGSTYGITVKRGDTLILRFE